MNKISREAMMARLFVMRHGEAVPKAASDSLRSLTQLGYQQAQSVAEWFKKREVNFQQVLVSPYVRAQQTWKSVAESIDFKGEVIVEENLKPSGQVSQVIALINSCLPNNMLIVSHLPLVGYLVQALSQQTTVPMFATGAVAELTLSDTFGAASYYGMYVPTHK